MDHDIGGLRLRLITNHLGVRAFERRRQVAKLLASDHLPVVAEVEVGPT